MIENQTKGNIICQREICANAIGIRMRGMIGRKFDSFDGMYFPRCNAIHMFFMTIPLDIVFLDAKNIVVKTAEKVRPWIPALAAWNASSTLELPVGSIPKLNIAVGDQLSFK